MKKNRNTVQRILVLETVKKLNNHPTADEVYLEIAKTYSSISRATVYRNLGNLANENLINKVELPNSADRYDDLLHSHYHFTCILCGFTMDVNYPYMISLGQEIKNTNGFEIHSHDIIFKGICEKCKKQNI